MHTVHSFGAAINHTRDEQHSVGSDCFAVLGCDAVRKAPSLDDLIESGYLRRIERRIGYVTIRWVIGEQTTAQRGTHSGKVLLPWLEKPPQVSRFALCGAPFYVATEPHKAESIANI